MRQRFSFVRYLIVFYLAVLGLPEVAEGQTALEIGRTIERDLNVEETHSYQLPVKPGEFVRVVVRQKNSDVSLTGFRPDGQQFNTIDNSNTVEERERISFISEEAGTFRIEVKFIAKLPKNDGRAYEITLETRRPVREPDKTRVLAESFYDQANQLRFRKERESKENAVVVFRKAVPLFAAAQDKEGESLTLYALGQVLGQLGDYAGAQTNYEHAAAGFRESADLAQLAVVLENSAPVYFRQFNLPKTIAVLTEARNLYDQTKNRRGGVRVASKFGLVYQTLGETERAINAYTQALPLLEELGDLSQKATTLSNLATLQEELGDIDAALANYSLALELRRRLDERIAVANTLTNLASVYHRTGEHEKFIAANDEALSIYRDGGDRFGEATCLNNRAAFYFAIGQLARAAEKHQEALTIWKRLDLPQREAQTLVNFADVQLAQKKWAAALENYRLALQVTRRIADRQTEGQVLTRLGAVSLKQNDSRQAVEFFDQALSIAQQTRDIENEADIRLFLAEIQRVNGEGERALENLRAALAIQEKVKDSAAASTVLVQMSQILSSKGELAEAQKLAEVAVRNIENRRRAISRSDYRAGFVASRQKTYENLIAILIRRDRAEPGKGFAALALQTSEQARARNLLESIGELNLTAAHPELGSLNEREQKLLRAINEKEFRRTRFLLAGDGASNVAALDRELSRLIDELRQIQAEIRLKNPRLDELKEPPLVSVGQIQKSILDVQTVLLEYFTGEERSWLFFVSQNDFEVIELPAETEITRTAQPFIAALRNVPHRKVNESDADHKRRTAQAEKDAAAGNETLSRMLLGPVASRIAGKRLLIVGSGILQYLPFGVLRPASDGKYLIETNEIVNLPSAAVLSVLRGRDRPAPSTDLTIFADPVFDLNDPRLAAKAGRQTAQPQSVPTALRGGLKRLEFSRYEAEAIARLFSESQRTVALDFRANLQLTRQDAIRQARFVHFATHGWVNSEQPELSGIVLSLVDETGAVQDGFLRLNEIYNLRLSAELVVLSACETGLGEEIRGEGIIGLTRGFMHAGAPRVISSLWSVDDRATFQLMRRVYENMLTGKLSPAAALRKAQISLIAEKSFANPFYWAAFTIHGEFK